jgi:NAD(P)-dependent dehydrogenase (short-subunit alcohol dehydrogenase family)
MSIVTGGNQGLGLELINMPYLTSAGGNDSYINYAASKAANRILTDETAKRCGKHGIFNVV